VPDAKRKPSAKYFKTPAEFRLWLAKHHRTKTELFVGFHKRDTGKPSITWPESVDQALCFGWIDGVRQSLGETSYTIRFTPRRGDSTWSAVNIRRVRALQAEGLMKPVGLQAFERRTENKSGVYSYEQRPDRLPATYELPLRKNRAAWSFFQAQPPWYQRVATWWVISAKKEETRAKRLDVLIKDCAEGRRLDSVARHKPAK
jgi:uncharacterized protein YdeI (YjbR/CyaY-like superfamily)